MSSEPFLHFSRQRLPVIRQAEAAECGLACLAMVLAYHGHQTTLARLRQSHPVSLRGLALRNLIDTAAAVGLAARPLRCELGDLGRLKTPAILHWSLGHYVVLKRVRRGRALIHDPALGAVSLSLAEVSEKFTGVAVELTPTPVFAPRRDARPLTLRAVVRWPSEVRAGLAQAVVLSVVIEALLLAAPLYMQLLIDQATPRQDLQLVTILALAFGAATIFNALANGLRAMTLQFISSVLTFDLQARMLHHLLRLPLGWFHKRSLGDVQSRFSAIKPIQDFIAKGALATLLDGVLGGAVLVLMLKIAPALALVAMVSVAAYLAIRLSMASVSQRLGLDWLNAEARQESSFLETLRAAETIKAAASESARASLQLNAMADTLNASVRNGNVLIGYDIANRIISGLADVLVLYLGARAILGGDMSVGVLMAFMAYKRQFTDRASGFIEQILGLRLLDIHLDRLADIALSQQEDRRTALATDRPMEGRVECRQLIFAYGRGEPLVLNNFSLAIEAGEFVAITGPSGCGKSTLLKLLSGLYAPAGGQVLVDGRPLDRWSLDELRRQIGVVSQDDQLLAGSIGDNIAFFDERPDMERIVQCARLANLDRDIAAMPMAYRSLVGDMGSALSGGQKQRLLIARALYRQPRILILDEGTSHLDLENEQAINLALKGLAITRIVVAHRPETIRAADREIRLGEVAASVTILAPEGAPVPQPAIAS